MESNGCFDQKILNDVKCDIENDAHVFLVKNENLTNQKCICGKYTYGEKNETT